MVQKNTQCVLNVADTDYSFKAVIEALWYAISSPSTSRQESLLSYIGAVSTLNAAPIIMQATEVYFKSLLLLQCIWRRFSPDTSIICLHLAGVFSFQILF